MEKNTFNDVCKQFTKRFTTIIFDLDNTLIATRKADSRTCNKVNNNLKISFHSAHFSRKQVLSHTPHFLVQLILLFVFFFSFVSSSYENELNKIVCVILPFAYSQLPWNRNEMRTLCLCILKLFLLLEDDRLFSVCLNIKKRVIRFLFRVPLARDLIRFFIHSFSISGVLLSNVQA